MGRAVSAGRKAGVFRYTDDQRKALAAAVPDPVWLDKMDDWGRLASFAHHAEFRSDKAGYVASALERVARECLLEEEALLRSLNQNLAHVRKVARQARQLRAALLKPNKVRPNFAVSFLGIGMLVDDQGDYVPLHRHEVFLSLLDDVIENEASVAEAFVNYHAEDAFDSRRHAGFAKFVDAAIIYWRAWTDKPAGGSKAAGGPAARFLCAAANPVITFAERQGLQLRQTRGALTVEAAGELIVEARRAEPLD